MDNVKILQHRYLTDVEYMEEITPYEKSAKDPIITTMFMEDPITGKPSSDLGLIFSSNTPVDVKEYIRSQLAIARKVEHAPDIETSEATLKRQFESREQYYERVQQFIKDNSNVD